jgi:peptide/nickel transport system substrate-binding protein
MFIRRVHVVAAATAVAVLLGCNTPAPPAASGGSTTTATGQPAATGQPTAGGTVVMGVTNDASILNPNLTTGSPDGWIGCLMYEGLVNVKLDGTAEPLLAKSWDVSPDALTYTFHLVNAQWQDGQPFTSADVKYTFTEVSPKYSSSFASSAAAISSIDTPDDHTVVIHLSHPYGPFLITLRCGGGGILPAHIFQGTDVPSNPASLTKPVGTGPFRLTEWVPGDHFTLSKNSTYWDSGKPHLDKLIFRIIPNASSRVLALQSDEVQYLDYGAISPNDYDTIRSNPQLYLHEELFPPPDDIMFFNVKNGPTSDVMVRKALAMATDREYLRNTIWLGLGDVGISSFDTRIPWSYNPQVDYRTMFPFDAQKAANLLDQAGYKPGADGVRFSLDYVVPSTTPTVVAAGEALKNMWAAIGVNLNLITLDTPTMLQRVFKDGNFNVTIQGYTTMGDPGLGVIRQFASSLIGVSYGNASFYSSPEVDQLIEQGQNAPVQSDRAKAYYQIQVIIANDLPSLIVHQRIAYDAASKRIQGAWDNNYIGYGDWTNAWLQR